MIHAKWDRRIRRANELISTYPFAAEGLRYYAQLATFQKRLYAEIQKALADSPKISSARPLRDELDLFLLLPNFSAFLSVIQQIAPVPLAQAAAGLAQKGPAGWQHAIEDFWYRDPELAMAVDDTEEVRAGDPLKATSGFSSNRTQSILPLTASQQSMAELHRPARFAAASLSSAY
jgi:hypothetical protein